MTLQAIGHLLWPIDIFTIYGLMIVYLGLKLMARKPKNLVPQPVLFGLATLILILSVVRFGYYIILFGDKALAMDFACFYTGGESMNFGLSPYVNNINHLPPVWDGISVYAHSRYVYPPIIGTFFQFFALFPYHVAKHLWMGVVVVTTVIMMRASWKIIPLKQHWETIAMITAAALLYYPLLTELERGQVDTMTGMLNFLAIGFMLKNKKRDLWAGVCFAVSTLFKLYTVYILVFLVFRKKWKVIAGYFLGIAAASLISWAVNGPMFIEYWSKEFPRISWIGEWGAKSMRVHQKFAEDYKMYTDTPQYMTTKGGHSYSGGYEIFFSWATLVESAGQSPLIEPIAKFLHGLRLAPQTRTVVSLLILSFFSALILALQKFIWEKRPFSRVDEFMYWQSALIVILLSGSRTWSMNTVWILPVIILLFHYIQSVGLRNLSQSTVVFWGLGLAGFGILFVPHHAFILLFLRGQPVWQHLYLFGEILVLVALLGLISCGGKTSAQSQKRVPQK